MIQASNSEQLRRLNKAHAAIALQAAELLQQKGMTMETRRLADLPQAELAFRHLVMAEEQVFWFKMWLQSPDEFAYRRRKEKAWTFITEIRSHAEAWFLIEHRNEEIKAEQEAEPANERHLEPRLAATPRIGRVRGPGWASSPCHRARELADGR